MSPIERTLQYKDRIGNTSVSVETTIRSIDGKTSVPLQTQEVVDSLGISKSTLFKDEAEGIFSKRIPRNLAGERLWEDQFTLEAVMRRMATGRGGYALQRDLKTGNTWLQYVGKETSSSMLLDIPYDEVVEILRSNDLPL